MEWKALNLRLIWKLLQGHSDWIKQKNKETFFSVKNSIALISHIPCNVSSIYDFFLQILNKYSSFMHSLICLFIPHFLFQVVCNS